MPAVGLAHQPATPNQATVVVKAERDVQIKANGQLLTRLGVEQPFVSPDLAAGIYTYKFDAEVVRNGKTFTETKTVLVKAGRRLELDFTTLGKGAATAQAEPGNLTVVLPAGALLTVNEVAVDASGTKTFPTMPLVKGERYFYTIKAEMMRDGKVVADTRRVDVFSGKTSTVDFTSPTAAVASRR